MGTVRSGYHSAHLKKTRVVWKIKGFCFLIREKRGINWWARQRYYHRSNLGGQELQNWGKEQNIWVIWLSEWTWRREAGDQSVGSLADEGNFAQMCETEIHPRFSRANLTPCRRRQFGCKRLVETIGQAKLCKGQITPWWGGKVWPW